MLLNEIINLLLSKDDSSLSDALLKTKVFLHEIGKKELVDWVNHELNGYPDGATVPEYRKLHSEVRANVSNVAWRAECHPIPIGHLKPKMRENLDIAIITRPLSVIEDMASREGGWLRRSIPMEYNGLLSKGLSNNFKVESAWCQTPSHDFKGITTQVRSRLLDFLLELQSSIGDVADDVNLKEKVASFDATSLFNHAIFGSNTTIVVGHHNLQTVRSSNVENDLDALTRTLTTIGIPPDEIDGLQRAIAVDHANGGKPSFEGQTGNWFSRLVGRAARGGLSVGVDVVSSTVAKALNDYLGGGH
jgi:hypothetical protein